MKPTQFYRTLRKEKHMMWEDMTKRVVFKEEIWADLKEAWAAFKEEWADFKVEWEDFKAEWATKELTQIKYSKCSLEEQIHLEDIFMAALKEENNLVSFNNKELEDKDKEDKELEAIIPSTSNFSDKIIIFI